MATQSSILAWKIPWTEEPGGLQSMDCKESDTTEWKYTYIYKWSNSSSTIKLKVKIFKALQSG